MIGDSPVRHTAPLRPRSTSSVRVNRVISLLQTIACSDLGLSDKYTSEVTILTPDSASRTASAAIAPAPGYCFI